jgi:hypothetical protein
MVIGWVCFQGPARALFAGKQAQARKKPAETALADASRPARDDKEDDRKEQKIAARPPDKPAPKTPSPPPNPEIKQPQPAPAAPAPMPKPDPLPAGTPLLTFEKNVLPIFEKRCISCHGTPRKRGGLDMRTMAALLKGGENGPSLVPGKPEQSLLWETIATNRMPPGQNKLSQAERILIQDWIAGGARTAQAAGR